MPQRFGQVSIYFGLPTFLTDATDSLGTGFSFESRFGFDLGLFVPEVGFGTQINWFDDPSSRDTGSLSAWWLTVGLRFQWINRSIFTPFLSGAIDMNFWHLSGDEFVACDLYYCGTVDNYRFAPGLSSRVGIVIEPHHSFGVELGVRTAMTFEGSMFDQPEAWLSPFLGGTFYF